MNRAAAIKDAVLAVLAAAGTVAAKALGGWDSALTTLILFMAADYVTGLIVAGVFRRSSKSESGALSSKAGFKGLCRKGGILLVVLIAARLDLMTGTGKTLRTVTVLFFLGNEGLSIVENLGVMGVPIPKKVQNALEALREKDAQAGNGADAAAGTVDKKT